MGQRGGPVAYKPKEQKMMRQRNISNHARRGVLLLVVLSLLMLFSLVAVTFVLLSSRHYETTRYAVKHEQTGDDPRNLLDNVFAQCVRGTDNPHSVIGPHSLLEDLYGNDGISYKGTVTVVAPQPYPNTPVLTLNVAPAAAPNFPNAGSANSFYYNGFATRPVYADRPAGFQFPFSAIELQTIGYMNGRVFTAVGGAADGLSTRVLGWSYATGVYTINLLAFEGVTPAAVQNDPPTGFVINGRPFSGTGFGFNPAADPATTGTMLSASQSFDVPIGATTETFTTPYALLPNPVFFGGRSDSGVTVNNDPNYSIVGGIGGADEDYDAPDAQNMLLAYVPLNANTGGVSRVIPSLHRPEMIQWLRQQNTDSITNVVYGGSAQVQSIIERQASLRPDPNDHDEFPKLRFDFNGDGTLEDSTSFSQAYDVDNDGDGVTDSIWVDAGLPVRTGPDGRMYKPMVAILCVDLDGRLNVNAQGTIAHTNPAYATTIAPGTSGAETIANYLFSSTGVGAAVTMQRGLGAGPAEINLRGLFATPADYLRLFKGGNIAGVDYEGRYGEWNLVSGTYGSPLPGRSASTLGADDYLAQIARFGRPTNYFGGTATGYNSPGDLWGRMAIGLDHAGQPVYSYLKTSGSELVASSAVANRPENELPYDPYSVNLMRSRAAQNMPTANDNLFSVAELERLLRTYDGDSANLPDRLRTILSSSTLELSKLVTTDSFDVPVSNAAITRDMATLMRTQNGNKTPAAAGIIELSRARIVQALGVAVTDPQVQTKLNTLLSPPLGPPAIAPELIAGQTFNINRSFGNGQDDDADGIVDEPDEYSTANEVPTAWSGITGFTVPGYLDLDRNGNATADVNEGIKVRQAYAQQLYFLMMLVSDQTYMWSTASTMITPAQQAELTSRQIAQWAINVVDFRDPDAIMTGFEYDLNPFNGWDVDGDLSTDDPSTDRRVVWGVEFPELLLTETLALHDRMVSDQSMDTGGNKKRVETMPPGDPDEDATLDQTHVPQGSVFFELLNTRPASPAQHYPAELYSGGKLDLGKVTPPDAMSTVWPVWRIAITESIANPQANITERAIRFPDSTGFGPTDNGADKGRVSIFRPGIWGSMVTVERMVIFSTMPPAGTGFEDVAFFNRNSMPTLLQPGGIALIGPRPLTSVGTNGGGAPATQKIRLTPTVEIFNSLNPTGYFANHATGMQPLPIICSSVRRPPGWTPDKFPTNHNIGVNVTEPMPLAYYTQVPSGTYDNLQNQPPAYGTPLDKPLDSSDPNSLIAGLGADAANGLTTILHTGSTGNYKHAILQRLANPLEAFHPLTNPYITVDWQPIPLVMFNGQATPQADRGSDMLPWDSDDPNWGSTPPATLTLTNYGRGLFQLGTPSFDPWNIVSPLAVQALNTTMPPQAVVPYTASQGIAADVFPYTIKHTLGYLNSEIGTPWDAAALAAYKNVPQPTGPSPKPYPWLTWNNRPYVSEAELMLVPAASAEELLRNFTAPQNPATPVSNPYILDPKSYHLPFKHLFNFRLSSSGVAGTAPNYARVLDYLHVPSPFIDTEQILNWNTTLGNVTGSPSLLAPFNTVSHMREPGRININTIPGDAIGSPSPVWDAIRNTASLIPNPGPEWSDIISARRGTTGAMFDNTTYSSFFARPFRGASGSMYALPGTLPGAYPGTPISEVESTLLRPAAIGGDRGLFEDRTTSIPYADPVRNAYFHHQPLLRTRNLLTTRSNVYAIWITVGYFEARSSGGGPGTAFPDGYKLFPELGSDTGEVKRHRAFYIYDRSIPVAFERGKDHNISDGILLKRFIE